jgi:ribonuclease HI
VGGPTEKQGTPPHVTIYTDGACAGNPGPGGWAAILRHDESRRVKELSGRRDRTTNNEMEMWAVEQALRAIKVPGSIVTIYTDSENVIGWLSQGWKCKLPHLQRIKNNIQAICSEMRLDVSYVKVAGHAGDRLNERANALAQAAIGR